MLALGAGLLVGLRWFAQWIFDGVDTAVSAALVAAMATTMVSVLGVVLARYYERRQQVEIGIRERKIPTYQALVEGLIRGMFAGVEGRGTTELEAAFKQLTPQLITWASDDVIKAWNQFKQLTARNPEPVDVMLGFEKVLVAVRADLGHKSSDLATGALLGLFINDVGRLLSAHGGPGTKA